MILFITFVSCGKTSTTSKGSLGAQSGSAIPTLTFPNSQTEIFVEKDSVNTNVSFNASAKAKPKIIATNSTDPSIIQTTNISFSCSSNVCNGTMTLTPEAAITGSTDVTIEISAKGKLSQYTITFYVVGKVDPVYPINGSNWMDWVRNPNFGTDKYSQVDAACTGAAESGLHSCLHGGALKEVLIAGHNSCTGLSFRDSASVFEWECIDTSGTATFYSKQINNDKGLQDLITGTAWNDVSGILTKNSIDVYTSPASAWWTNAIAALPDNSSASQFLLSAYGVSGTIFVLENTREGNNYRVDIDKIALLVADGAELRYGNDAASTPCYSGTRCQVNITADYAWIEGAFNGQTISGPNNSENGIYSVSGSEFVTINNSEVYNQDLSGMHIFGDNNYLSSVSVHDNSSSGIWAFGAQESYFKNIKVFNNVSNGFYCQASPDSLGEYIYSYSNGLQGMFFTSNCVGSKFRYLRAANNDSKGISMNNGVTGMHFFDLVAFNNGNANFGYGGIEGHVGDGSTIVKALSFNNAPNNFWMQYDDFGTVSHVTLASNGSSFGFHLRESDDVTINSIVAANSTLAWGGIQIRSALRSKVYNLVAASNQGAGVYISLGGDDTIFGGHMLVGNNADDCFIHAGAATPNIDTNCASSANLVTGIDLTNSFVGKATTDSVNTEASTNESFASVSDWLDFESSFRGWGASGSVFPNTDNQGQCLSGGASCQVWDWRLSESDTFIRNTTEDGNTQNTNFVSGLACPGAVDGDVTIVDSQTIPNTFLQHAIEIVGDAVVGTQNMVGDDDGLCESNEACIYAPNFGAYQGEGNYETSGTCLFVDGVGADAVTGVTMYAYPTNGVN
jgi:hypothetical protein